MISKVCTSSTSRRRGFTLSEIMVVMGILVLLAGMTMPVYRVMTGSRSIEIAQNKISSMLSRSRALAMINRQITGVMFFQNPTQTGYSMAIVHVTPQQLPPQAPYSSIADSPFAYYLDVDSTQGFETLPAGVQAQGILNPYAGEMGFQGSTGTGIPYRIHDGYLGYNKYVLSWVSGNLNHNTYPTAIAYGPVILFDAAGHVTCVPYSFRCRNINVTPNAPTAMGMLLYQVSATATPPYDAIVAIQSGFSAPTVNGVATEFTQQNLYPGNGASNYGPIVQSQVGVVLFDDGAFRDETWTMGDPLIDPTVNNGQYGNDMTYGPEYGGQQSEFGEELWIDQFGSFFNIDRATGGLARIN